MSWWRREDPDGAEPALRLPSWTASRTRDAREIAEAASPGPPPRPPHEADEVDVEALVARVLGDAPAEPEPAPARGHGTVFHVEHPEATPAGPDAPALREAAATRPISRPGAVGAEGGAEPGPAPGSAPDTVPEPVPDPPAPEPPPAATDPGADAGPDVPGARPRRWRSRRRVRPPASEVPAEPSPEAASLLAPPHVRTIAAADLPESVPERPPTPVDGPRVRVESAERGDLERARQRATGAWQGAPEGGAWERVGDVFRERPRG